MNNEKNKDVFKTYDTEIKDIRYILSNLKNGRYYEKSGAKMDGYLNNNIDKLDKKITNLLKKIDGDIPSDAEVIADLFE